MNDFLSSFLNKISKKLSRRKTTKWNKNQIKLDLLKLEERLVPAPNLVVPTTTSGAPLGFVAGTNLAFSGALDIELLDTPTPASTGSFNTTVAATAGAASVTASGTATVTGSGTNSLTIAGNLADVNATLNSLTFTNSTTGAASLVVTASDSAGTPLTDTKTIYVNAADATAAPTITTALANVAYFAEATTVTEAAISFTVSDLQGSAGIVVTGTSSNTNLILNSNITIAGTYPNFTVTLKHQANVTGTALITLKVSDGTNFTTKSFNVSVVAPTAQFYWDLLAGSGTAGTANGTGAAATFNGPWQIAADTANNLYVGDYSSGTIRKITPAGVVTTIAGSATTGYLDHANPLSARFRKPLGVAVDNNGNVYVSEDGGYIRRIAYNSGTYGPVTTLVSSLGSSTTQWNMLVVTPDGSTVYVAKVSDKKIYKIDTATNTGAAFTTAFDNEPVGLSFDNSGNLLVREYFSSGFTSQVTPAGVVTPLIPQTTASYAPVVQLADGTYLSSFGGNIYRISSPTKTVTVGGSGADGVLGLGAAAGFADIRGMVQAPNGFIYVSDFSSTQNKIRVGKPYPSLLNPGSQSTPEATRLAFSNTNLAQLGAFANASDNSNVKLPLTYTLSVENGTLDFNNVAVPAGVTVTFSADRRSVTLIGAEAAINAYMLNFGYMPDANYINVKGDGTALASATSPDVISFSVTTVNNLTSPITGSLNLLVKATNNTNTPRIITALPDLVYLAESTITAENAIALTIADADTLATAFTNNATTITATTGRITATSDNPNLILPADIALAISGTANARTLTIKHQANITGVANITITIADAQGNQSTYTFKVTVKTAPNYYWDFLAGNGTTGTADGTGAAATFSSPYQIAADTANNLYVGDYSSGTIRKITPAGVVTTIAGSATTGYLDNANPLLAKFNKPLGVAVDNNGNVYVSEYGGYIRKIAYNSSSGTYGPVTTLVSSLGSSTTKWSMLVVTPDGSTVYVAKVSDKKIYKIDTATNTGAAFTTAFDNELRGLSFDNSGNLLVREMTSYLTYQVTPAGVVTILNSSVQSERY